MSNHYTKSIRALGLLRALLHSKKWKPHEIDAAQAGWEYILDMCSTKTGYNIRGMGDSNGDDEAMDLALGTISEPPWRSTDREQAADCIHLGIQAALKFVNEYPT